MPEIDIPMLHGPANTAAAAARIRRILVIFCVMTLAAAAVIAYLLIWRGATRMNNPNEQMSQILTIGVTLVWGALVLFFWGMKLTPLLCYRKYLRDIHRGLSRTVEGVLVRVDDDLTYRDGINCYAFILNVGNLDDPEDERLLYWDARLLKPSVPVGASVRVRAHGNDIIGFAS